ncbi:globin [Betaproteobacteria bacterium]|nr:globin [Betaproteobacteria bacterium]GHU15802.1 globin [Betaproteobacteria bacterium]
MVQSNPLYLGDLYADIGGEAGIKQLVTRFYARMDTTPQFASLRAMHPASLEGSADKLFCFLSGWLGGPDLFVEKYGAPQLRARHLPFAIGTAERDQWVACMVLAMEDAGVEETLRNHLLGKFFKTADFMRNKSD